MLGELFHLPKAANLLLGRILEKELKLIGAAM